MRVAVYKTEFYSIFLYIASCCNIFLEQIHGAGKTCWNTLYFLAHLFFRGARYCVDYDRPGRRIFNSSAIMPMAMLPKSNPIIWWINLIPVLLRLFNMILLSLRVIQISNPARINSDKIITLSSWVEIWSDCMMTMLRAAGPIKSGNVSGISEISSLSSISSEKE